jgi:hypothetical protein
MANPYGVDQIGAAGFRARLAALVQSGRPLYLLAPAAGQGWDRLAGWGLEPYPETCRRLCTNWSAQGVGPVICALRRGDGPAAATPHWPVQHRLCEVAGPGLDGAGRRGLGIVPGREAVLDLGPGCEHARIRGADGAAAAILAEPPGEAAGAVLTVAPPPDGIVRLRAAIPVIIAEAACIARVPADPPQR